MIAIPEGGGDGGARRRAEGFGRSLRSAIADQQMSRCNIASRHRRHCCCRAHCTGPGSRSIHGCHFRRRCGHREDCRVLLHQVDTRGLLGVLALAVRRGGIGQLLGPPADASHETLPKWWARTVSIRGHSLNRPKCRLPLFPSAAGPLTAARVRVRTVTFRAASLRLLMSAQGQGLPAAPSASGQLALCLRPARTSGWCQRCSPHWSAGPLKVSDRSKWPLDRAVPAVSNQSGVVGHWPPSCGRDIMAFDPNTV